MLNINDRLKNYTHASDGTQFYLVSGSSGRHIDISQKMSIAILAKKDLSAAISDLFDRKCSLTRANLGVMELMTSDLAAEEKNFSTLLKSAEQKLATAKLCYRDEDRIELEELISLDNAMDADIRSNEKLNVHHAKTTTIISALRIMARDIDSEDGVINAALEEAAERMEELLVLIDGAYDRIELYKPTSSEKYNIKWRKNWLETAKKCGAEPS